MSEADVRIDKWLYAARFYKTRALAKKAIETGKVWLNDSRPKCGRKISVGDQLVVQRGQFRHAYNVLGLSERRGPAKVAQTLYQETSESLQAYEAFKEKMSHAPTLIATTKKPDKKALRSIRALKRS